MSLTEEQLGELVQRTQDAHGPFARWRAGRAVRALGNAFAVEPDAGTAAALITIGESGQAGTGRARKALSTAARSPVGVDLLADQWTAHRSPVVLDALRDAHADVGHDPERLALGFALGSGPTELGALDDAQVDAVTVAAADADAGVGEPARELLVAALGTDADRARRALTAVARSRPGGQGLAGTWLAGRDQRVLDVLAEANAIVAGTPENVPLLLALNGLTRDLPGFDTEHAAALIGALDDPDDSVRAHAQQLLRTTTRQTVVDTLAARWAPQQSPQLGELVLANRTLPSNPDLALLVSIAQRRPDVVDREGPPAVDQALGWIIQIGFPFAAETLDVLGRLQSAVAQERMCEWALRGEQYAIDCAVRGRYLPSGDPQRAAFLLFTEQWERFTEFDFDGRLLAAYYATAPTDVQARLRDLVRRSGHTGVLRMLLGGNRRDRVRRITRPEADYLAESLIAQGQFAEAFKLVFELPFEWGLALAVRLHEAGWAPDGPDERMLLDDLITAHRRGDAHRVASLINLLPLAVRRASARVAGVATAVSFAPDALELAIGTNARQVGVWDLQRARLNWRHGVHGVVSHVLHRGQGSVLATERAQLTSATCRAYTVTRSGCTRLGAHTGSINGLGVLSDGAVLTAGRDGYLRVWSNGGRPPIPLTTTADGRDWPRAIAVADGGGLVASVHRGVNVVSLATHRVSSSTRLPSAASAAAFAPGGDDVVIGMHNGRVHVCRRSGGLLREAGELSAHPSKIVAIVCVSERGLLLTAGLEGFVRAYAWPSRNLIGELRVGPLKSVTVSPHGEWIAMGHEDRMSLWDFRVAEIPGLFALPLVATTPAHLGLIESAAEGVRAGADVACLSTMTAMLRHRFRHDIELSEAPVAIRAGTFDIELG